MERKLTLYANINFGKACDIRIVKFYTKII